MSSNRGKYSYTMASGNKGELRRLLEYTVEQKSKDYLCTCFKDKANAVQQGYNDPSISANMRTAQIIRASTVGGQGGRIVFVPTSAQVGIQMLGGAEGQPGGLPRPPRRF